MFFRIDCPARDQKKPVEFQADSAKASPMGGDSELSQQQFKVQLQVSSMFWV